MMDEIWADVTNKKKGYSHYECNKHGDIIVKSKDRTRRALQNSTQKIKGKAIKKQGGKIVDGEIVGGQYRLIHSVNGLPLLYDPENIRDAAHYGAELVPVSRKLKAG